MKAPAQQKPLTFECRQCGYCCRKHGRYAYVYATPQDIRRMAGHLALTPQAFRAKFTKVLTHGTVLKFEKGHCIFFQEGSGCLVHEAKPRQCATWPYWPGNVKDGRFTPAVLKICKGCANLAATRPQL